MARTPAETPAAETGSAMITVLLLSLVMSGLLATTLARTDQADRSSGSDRNSEVALAVAEAGVDQAIARLHASGGTFTGPVGGRTAEGAFTANVSRNAGGFSIDSTGEVGTSSMRRRRRVVTGLTPPVSFARAIMSETSIEIKNNDHVTGEVWANASVRIGSGGTIDGSIVAARGWIELGSGARVTGDVRTGGADAAGDRAMLLSTNAEVSGDATAAAGAAGADCPAQSRSLYDIELAGGSRVGGDAVTWGEVTGAGTVSGAARPSTCSQAPATEPLPTFSYAPANYDPTTLRSFTTVAGFQTWLASRANVIDGTIWVQDAAPSQSNRIDLTGVTVAGDTTIVTNTPVFSNAVAAAGSRAVFVLASTYRPAAGSGCDVNHDASDCTIHLKNGFEPACDTAVLVYAPNGTIAVKNNADSCGAVYGGSVLVKNNQRLTYDPRIARVAGFGASTYIVSSWEERVP